MVNTCSQQLGSNIQNPVVSTVDPNRLPSSAIQCENEANIRLENSLPNSLLNSTSRKGLYICLCCRSTFTSSALYEDHLDRAVARILYRCHICRGSWTTSREAVSIADNHESETCSRFYSVLPGGIISANNKCAIFTHLVSAHPDKRSDWILRPSLLTICPLVMPTTFLNLAAQTASTTTDIQSFDVSNEQQAPTRLTSNQLVKTHLMNDLCKSRVWSDLQHSLSNISALGSLDFLQPSSLCKQVSSNRVGRLTRTCNDIVVERFSSLKRIFTPSSNNSESNLPSLPCSDSVLYRLILNSATSEIWHSHLFLPEWCSDEIRTIGTPARTTATATTKTVNRQDENNPVTIQTNNNNDDDNENDNVENGQTNYCDNSVNVGDSYSAMSRKVCDTCLPPSAPSNAHLNLALNAILSSYRSPQSSTPSSSLSQQQQQPFGVLRCLLCKFKTNDKQRLKMHLMGSGRTVVNTKCGLCGQLLSIEQPNLCLIKAHILLHLGCHIMCPQCGFTPPAYLSPDCAELCLRAHLRFVCYHFNLREIFQCCYCHEMGNKKGYKAFENLCQHYFECHTRRIYSCLLCVQHQKQLQSIVGISIDNSQQQQQQQSTSFTIETSSFEELTNHMKVIHGANTPPGAMNSSTSTVHPISGFLSESQTVLLPPSLVNMNGPPVVHGNGNYNASVMSENADYSTRYQCIECLRVLDTREEYFRHFSAEHRSACIQENYYRCFGSCKRLFPNIDIFREHLSVCQHAQTIFRSTFGYSYTYSNDNNDNNNSNKDILNLLDPEHTDDNQQQQAQQQQSVRTYSSCENNASSSSASCASSYGRMNNNASVIFDRKLCFCAYCGIGPRRNTAVTGGGIHPSSTEIITTTSRATTTRTTTTTMTSTSYSLCMDHPHAQMTSDSLLLPAESNVSDEVTPRGNNEINLVLQNQESVADNGSSSDCSQQLLQQQQQHQLQESPSNCETTPFTARYFTDLINLHNHERDSHFFDSRKLIACPWCHKQLTFSKKDNANVTYEHLLSHVHEHYMVSWCLARTRQWNENAKALPHCVCGLALLDSPLAILSHSGTHLIHADKYKSSCIVLPDPIQLRRLKRQHPNSSSSSSNNRQYSSEEFLFPKPNDHIPCCIEVYRHLRFGVSPQFDAHLLEATKGSLTFTCPICPTVLCTRWALTQHAFSEHWGTLCYICCIYTFNSDENSPSLDISTDDGNVQMPNACPSMSSLPTIASSSSSSLSPSSLMTTKKIASTSTTATPTPPTEIIVPHSMEISANLWDHIFQCMNQRRDLLNNSHHHQHGPFPSMSSLSMSSAPSSSSSLTKAGLRVNDVDNHHDHHPDQQQLFIREIDLDRSESSDCHDPGENFNDFALTIVSSPEHEKMTNNADKKCSDVGSSSTQIQDINETYLSSNISTDAISSTSVSTTTIPMTSNSSSLLSTAAPATAITTTTTTTNTSVVVAASAPLPSCSSAIEYVHKIFDNKSLKRKATTTSESCGSTSHKRLSLSLNKGDCSNDNSVQGSCHRSIEGVGGVSAGGDDNDEYSSTNNSATTTPCIDWGAQEQQVSGGISRSWDDTNVTEMSVSDRPIIPSGAVSNSSVPVVIYKCYLCRNKTYTVQFSFLRHMTLAHGLGTSELDWNRMIETNDAGPKNNNPNLLSLLNNNNNNPTTSGSASTAPRTTTTSSSSSLTSRSGECDREENAKKNSSSSGGGNRVGVVLGKIFLCKLCNKLPSSAIQCENEANIRLENSLPNSLLNSTSRKGLYICLCCRSTFTSSALYEDHLDRAVARILYRCHICRGSWTTSREAVSIADNHESETCSRFYSVLPGGIISANNKCAIFTHLVSAHPDKRSDWILRPSLLTICPLVMPTTFLNLAAQTASTTTDIQSFDVSTGPKNNNPNLLSLLNNNNNNNPTTTGSASTAPRTTTTSSSSSLTSRSGECDREENAKKNSSSSGGGNRVGVVLGKIFLCKLCNKDQCSSSNVIHNTASADTRLHLATGGECVNSLPFGNDTLSGSSSGVTLPPTTQSSGPRTSDAFNHRPVHSAVRNRCTLVPRPTPLSKGCTQPETGVLLNSQPPMVNTCSQQLGSNIQNPVVSTVDPNRLSISSAANRINEQILNPPPPPPMDENVLWGRVTRNSSGDLKFPGINRTFKSVSSVLRQIYQTAKAEDSLSLQLPSSAIQCENEANIRLENSLPNSLLNSTSRKGLYICLCCRSTFTSSALYEDHLDRAVARILYRCHICRGSWTTSREAVSIADNHESETCSRFYSVLPGGIISANNKCAIFTHLVSAHPDKRSDWILRPSLLTICPLVMPTTFLNLAAQTASTTTDIQSFDVSNEQQAPTRLTSNQLVKTHLMNDLCKSRVWSDLQHSLSNISALGSLDFLQPSSSASSLCKQVSSNRVGRLTRTCNDIVVERFSSLKRIFTPSSNNSESNLPSLPCSDSVLYRLILNSATSEIWHSHLFLPEWCSDEIRTIGTPARTTATATATTKTVNRQDENNPVTIQTNNNNDDDNDDNVENGQTNYCDNSVNVGDSYSAMSRKVSDTCLPPSAPSNAHLNLALNAILSSYRSPQSSTPSSSSSGTTALVQSSDSINRRGDLENSDNTPIQATSKHVMVTSSSDQPPSSSLSQQQQQPFGVLRCLLCKFKTNDKQRLKMHLMGSGRTVVNTKCGLCGQLLSIEQPNLCLIKAHILLHLGCHIMCPQCGFTKQLQSIVGISIDNSPQQQQQQSTSFTIETSSFEELTNHMRVIHGANTPPGAMNSSTSTVHPISGF
uniref:C2H2-type domain-containing protein n=1 Tax=Trichobilharzia regenti TaxID=157069 RepID=A0AA85J541_TRIRE|nr:unnamed protein product [Trichobilharzia regenti]